MEDIVYVGYRTNSNLYCEHANGVWSVELVTTQMRSADLENSDKKSASVKAFDKGLDRAVAQVYFTMAKYLEDLQGNLFEEENKELNDGSGTVQ